MYRFGGNNSLEYVRSERVLRSLRFHRFAFYAASFPWKYEYDAPLGWKGPRLDISEARMLHDPSDPIFQRLAVRIDGSDCPNKRERNVARVQLYR